MAANEAFIKWLNTKLQELNTDETVFGSYILGILEGEESDEEKQDALEGILQEILTDNVEDVIQSILKQWQGCKSKVSEDVKKKNSMDIDAQLAKLMAVQKLQTTVKEKRYTEEEKRIREQILAQYSQREVSEDEYEPGKSDDETDKHAITTTPSSTSANNHPPPPLSGVGRNTNVQDVLALQKERREQARAEAAAKKQKDKEDRERQKQLREEKKEKRKTVKGERRR